MHLGIDFGTSYTKLGYWSEHGFVNLAGAGNHIPTIAAYSPAQGGLYFGDLALRLDEPDISQCLFFKLALKRNLSFHLGPYSLAEIMEQFFRFLNREYVQTNLLEIDSITLSAPNYFGLQARRILIEAARNAFSCPEVKVLPEPAAALFGYNQTADRPLHGSILIIDIGGGTTDFSFLETGEEEIGLLLETQFQIGNDAFSGSEVDRNILRRLFLPRFEMETGLLIPDRFYAETLSSPRDRQLLTRWMLEAEAVKVKLNQQTQVNVHIPDFYQGWSVSMPISREICEWQLRDVFARLQTYCLQTVLEKARRLGLAAGQEWLLDAILLVGGGARMHTVQEIIATCFPDVNLVIPADSEHLVASGLCSDYSRTHLNRTSIKTIYPFDFYMQSFDDRQGKFCLKKIPFDTANLELDINLPYKITSITKAELPREAGGDQYGLCIYEAPQGEKDFMNQRFTGLEPVLNVQWPEETVPEEIDVYLNMKDTRLEINTKIEKRSDQRKTIPRLRSLIDQKETALDTLKNYPYISPELVTDYSAYLRELESQPLLTADNYSKTVQFQLLLLLQILTNRKI